MQRPTFAGAWNASLRIFDPVNSAERVASTIGGQVATNIRSVQHPWRNTCAVRLSYVLNYTGVHIPRIVTQTVTGGDHRHYFFRVRDVIQFLGHRWGKPDKVTKYPPPGGGELSGKKGVVLFEVRGWDDAAGHATLWNGSQCYDHCYFNEPGANYRTDRASFWALP